MSFLRETAVFFVKIDSVVDHGGSTILFLDCEVLADNKSKAVSHKIAMVNKEQFDHMQPCTSISALMDKGTGVLSGAAGLGMFGYAVLASVSFRGFLE